MKDLAELRIALPLAKASITTPSPVPMPPMLGVVSCKKKSQIVARTRQANTSLSLSNARSMASVCAPNLPKRHTIPQLWRVKHLPSRAARLCAPVMHTWQRQIFTCLTHVDGEGMTYAQNQVDGLNLFAPEIISSCFACVFSESLALFQWMHGLKCDFRVEQSLTIHCRDLHKSQPMQTRNE